MQYGGGRSRIATGVKLDYRWSDRTTVSLNTSYNYFHEFNDGGDHVPELRPKLNQFLARVGLGQVLPKHVRMFAQLAVLSGEPLLFGRDLVETGLKIEPGLGKLGLGLGGLIEGTPRRIQILTRGGQIELERRQFGLGAGQGLDDLGILLLHGRQFPFAQVELRFGGGESRLGQRKLMVDSLLQARGFLIGRRERGGKLRDLALGGRGPLFGAGKFGFELLPVGLEALDLRLGMRGTGRDALAFVDRFLEKCPLAIGFRVSVVEFALEASLLGGGFKQLLAHFLQAGIDIRSVGMARPFASRMLPRRAHRRHRHRSFADGAGADKACCGFVDHNTLPALRACEFDIGAYGDHFVPHSCTVFSAIGLVWSKKNPLPFTAGRMPISDFSLKKCTLAQSEDLLVGLAMGRLPAI